MNNRFGIGIIALAGFLSAACSDGSSTRDMEKTGETTGALRVGVATPSPATPDGLPPSSINPRHDVTQILFSIFGSPDAGSPLVVSQKVPLEPEGLPSNVFPPEAGVDNHPFGDFFAVLTPGDYLVSATPLAGDQFSTECFPATTPARVDAGLTTEVLLISNCIGQNVGGLDSVLALNTPPVIRNLTVKPSKFVPVGQNVTLTVDAFDPDGDPLTFVWSIGGLVLDSTTNSVTFTDRFPETDKVQVFIRDPHGLVNPGQSSTTLQVPIHFFVPVADGGTD